MSRLELGIKPLQINFGDTAACPRLPEMMQEIRLEQVKSDTEQNLALLGQFDERLCACNIQRERLLDQRWHIVPQQGFYRRGVI